MRKVRALSEQYNYIGHPEYKGGLEEPSEAEILEYESLQVLAGDKNKNIIADKHRLKLSQTFAALMEEKEELPEKTKKNLQAINQNFLGVSQQR